MNHKTITVLIIVAAVTFSAPLVMARSGGGRGRGTDNITGIPRGRWWNNSQIVEQIKLTDEQREKIQNTIIKYQKKVLDAKNEASKLELEFDPVMEADKFNTEKAKDLLREIQKYRLETMLIRGEMLIEFRDILSKEQYMKLKSIRGSRQMGRKGMKNSLRRRRPHHMRDMEGLTRPSFRPDYGRGRYWWKN